MGCKVNTSYSLLQICKSVQIFLIWLVQVGEGGGLIVFQLDSGSAGPSSSPEPETSCCVSKIILAGAFRGVGNSHGCSSPGLTKRIKPSATVFSGLQFVGSMKGFCFESIKFTLTILVEAARWE